MAGRKNFVAGEILTAADVNSFLMDQSVMVFDDSAARTTAIPTPTEGMVTYRKDDSRLEVFDGSAFGPVGTILQVVSTTLSSAFTTASTTYTDLTGLSASITPSATNSKVLVFYSVFLGQESGAFTHLRLMRDSTAIGIGDVAGDRDRTTISSWTGGDNRFTTVSAGNFLDSPETTSAVTYKFQTRTVSSGLVYVNRNSRNNDSPSEARGISTITLMEVAG